MSHPLQNIKQCLKIDINLKLISKKSPHLITVCSESFLKVFSQSLFHFWGQGPRLIILFKSESLKWPSYLLVSLHSLNLSSKHPCVLMNQWDWHLTEQLIVDKAFSVLRQWVRHCRHLKCSHSGCGAVFGVVSWVDTGVAGFTKKKWCVFRLRCGWTRVFSGTVIPCDKHVLRLQMWMKCQAVCQLTSQDL